MFLGWGQRGGSDTLGLGTTLALHSQGWTPLESRDSWGSCQQLLCLSCHPALLPSCRKGTWPGGQCQRSQVGPQTEEHVSPAPCLLHHIP